MLEKHPQLLLSGWRSFIGIPGQRKRIESLFNDMVKYSQKEVNHRKDKNQAIAILDIKGKNCNDWPDLYKEIALRDTLLADINLKQISTNLSNLNLKAMHFFFDTNLSKILQKLEKIKIPATVEEKTYIRSLLNLIIGYLKAGKNIEMYII